MSTGRAPKDGNGTARKFRHFGSFIWRREEKQYVPNLVTVDSEDGETEYTTIPISPMYSCPESLDISRRFWY